MVRFKKDRIFDYPLKEAVSIFMEGDDVCYDMGELQNVTQYKIVKKDDRGDKKIETKEWCAHAQIPKALQHIITPKMLTWFEHSVWDRNTNIYTFTIEPHYLKNKVSCDGKTIYREKDGKCARTFEMRLDVKIPILGQIFENVVIGLMKENEEQDYKLSANALKKAFAKV